MGVGNEDGALSTPVRRRRRPFLPSLLLTIPLTLLAHTSTIKRTAESLYVSTLKGLRAIGVPTTSLAVDADDVGAAIAQLAIHPPAEGVTELHNDDMIKLANEFRAAQNKARQA